MPQIKKFPWDIIGTTVLGASHKRHGFPNQDFLFYYKKGIFFLSISDGHGSRKYFRSHIGSRLAVFAAEEVIKEFTEKMDNTTNLSSIKEYAELRLPQSIIREWEKNVRNDLKSNPFQERELTFLEKNEGISVRKQLENNPIIAYGATLLSVFITNTYILYLQLGDGDILIVSEEGETSRPFPKDERLIANETTSLITKDAWKEFRVQFQRLSENPPALILVSSDGYANSFCDEESFLQIGSDFLTLIRADGLKKVEQNLRSWLEEASEKGCGDDISLGIISRIQLANRPLPMLI
ncbi:MAG: protein phosphatase 2C domain-containing protein [Candidatus Atribacteria bacterium]|nr:protein phosphatase 2C domain-containing protein [Candidatus Atribacteria bacterium]